MVELEVSPTERVQVELGLSPGAACYAEPAPKLRRLDEAAERLRERAFVPRRNEDPGLAVLDELGEAADRGRDHGQLRGHRFQHRDGQPLRPAREHEYVGRG